MKDNIHFAVIEINNNIFEITIHSNKQKLEDFIKQNRYSYKWIESVGVLHANGILERTNPKKFDEVMLVDVLEKRKEKFLMIENHKLVLDIVR